MSAQRLAGKVVAIVVDFNFEDMEVMYPKIRLEEEGAEVWVVGGKAGLKYTGKYGYPILSTHGSEAPELARIDALVLPGGFAPDYYRRNSRLRELTTRMMAEGKAVAAICHGPWMLCSARTAEGAPVISGYRATCFEAIKDDVINAGAAYTADKVVVDRGLITAQTPAELTPFCLAIIEQLA